MLPVEHFLATHILFLFPLSWLIPFPPMWLRPSSLALLGILAACTVSLVPASPLTNALPVQAEARASTSSSSYIYPDLRNASIHDLQQGLEAGHFTSVDLVKAYLGRINETNDVLQAVLEVAPEESLLRQARELDDERKKSGPRSPLHGLPILLKDNIAIDSKYHLNTTAGSYTLLNSIVPGDAPLVENLHAAGGIVLGKAQMSVWAQFRGNLTQGWSPRGGYSSSAYLIGGNPCSSSSGSGIAASIGLAPIILGSETDGSINCPASRNGVVGFKPTVGLVSRFGVIPISSTQDTVGPLVRWVEDVATILTTISTPQSTEGGASQLDAATADQPASVASGQAIDYGSVLASLSLKHKDKPLAGKRIGIVDGLFVNVTYNGFNEQVPDIYYEALRTLEEGGATLVNVTFDIVSNPTALQEVFDAETTILETEIQQGLESYTSYLTEVPSGTRNLGALVQFAYDNPELELPVTDQGDESDQSDFLTGLVSPFYAPLQPGETRRTLNQTYARALQVSNQQTRAAIRATLQMYDVTTIVGPADGFIYSLAAVAGSPSMTMPSGFLGDDVSPTVGTRPIWPFPGAPVGLSFIADRWQELELLKVGRGFEVMQQRKGLGGYDGVVRTLEEVTPTTQIVDVLESKS